MRAIDALRLVGGGDAGVVTADFVALSQTNRYWRGMASDGTNVYACVYFGDIYMQDNS